MKSKIDSKESKRMVADYSFQKKLIAEVRKHFASGKQKVVLAATPGAGKTRMATELIAGYARAGQCILVLTHGQTNLRAQFVEEGLDPYLEKHPGSFTYSVLGTGETAGQVHVALPHYFTAARLKRMRSDAYDIIVIDEAHHFYTSDRNQSIFRKVPGARHLLLTGTPSKFNGKEDFEVVGKCALDLIDRGVLTDPLVELWALDREVGMDEFDSESELPRSSEPSRAAVAEAFVGILGMLPKEKTVVFAHSRKQAKWIQRAAKQLGRRVRLSVSGEDQDSAELESFKASKRKDELLIVVRRGVLGFNDQSLRNAIDFSYSLNPDTIFQGVGRVMRVSTGSQKRFVKVTPKNLHRVTEHVLRFTLALAGSEDFFGYDGNWKFRGVVVPRDVRENLRTETESLRTGKSPLGTHGRLPFRSTMREAWDLKTGPAERVAVATFDQDVRPAVGGNRSLTDEVILASARRFSTRTEWFKEDQSTYSIARKNPKLFEKCVQHMTVLKRRTISGGNRSLTDEDLVSIARRFKTRTEWSRGDSSAYLKARKNLKLFEKCVQHMAPPSKGGRPRILTDGSILARARMFKTRTEWLKADQSAYVAAKKRSRALFERCVQHMT
jgi:superfamily II DNA or RNA helicase